MSQPTYLDEKSEGDHSMSVKQGTGEAFKPMEVLRDSHAMVKATCLKSSPQRYIAYSSVRTLDNDVACRHTLLMAGYGTFWKASTVQRDRQGDERTTYSVLLQGNVTKHGIAYGPRGLWRRSTHSSRSVGKPRTWRRGAGATGFEEPGGTRDA